MCAKVHTCWRINGNGDAFGVPTRGHMTECQKTPGLNHSSPVWLHLLARAGDNVQSKPSSSSAPSLLLFVSGQLSCTHSRLFFCLFFFFSSSRNHLSPSDHEIEFRAVKDLSELLQRSAVAQCKHRKHHTKESII